MTTTARTPRRVQCGRCKDTGIDPEHSTGGSIYGDFLEPPALEPCEACTPAAASSGSMAGARKDGGAR